MQQTSTPAPGPFMSAEPRRRPARVVIAKAGLDGHDRGAKIVARALRDAGMEVVYMGVHQTPEAIVQAALQEDADAIGVSLLSGAHLYLLQRIRRLMQDNGLDDVPLFAGGIIPDEDVLLLQQHDIRRVFHPGASMDEIVRYVTDLVGPRTPVAR